ncbi:MAG: TIR domain-containing protein, partial [Thermodesulfovibrionales bacterium]|nr:TIR domain-containing protein [Thermodesulfovibrionales bacterium]
GNKTIDEIFQGLAETGVFVLFISDEALESKWVKTEIEKAYELIKKGNVKRFYPIIIDNKIKYDDNRIPKWIQENYNLKYVSKPTKSCERIKQILKTLSWDLYPKSKRLSQLFIGRTELIRKYEERIFDFDKTAPISMISTGIPSIGRRKFTFHCLKNSNKIREYYNPPTIFLGSRDSIEDFIISLYDLGFSQKERKDLFALLSREMKDKVELATDLLLEIEQHENVIFVIDNYSIVGQDSYIVDWFLEVVKNIRKINRLFICLISRSRIRFKQLIHADYIFAIGMPELERYERNALFSALLELEPIQINKKDFNTICELFNGFPEQVFFAFNIIITEGLPYLMENLYLIPDYNSEKVASVIQKYESDKFAIQIMGFLSDCEFVSLNFLDTVFLEESERIKSIIEDFANCFIIEFIGATKEYFRLNDAIRDYVQRIGIKLNEKYRKSLETHVRTTFEDYDTLERDMSDYVITVKEALKKGYDVPQELMLPSHFLNAMRDLYNSERRYNDVIHLADRVLLKEKYLEDRILREVRYWLCLSLARKKDTRMVKEVQKIDGPDHNFLLGFYYRLTGRHEEAIEKLTSVLDSSPGFYRAKRELVQVFINLEEYDMAFELAKENYELLKNNPYNLQSYFRCLIRKSNISPEDKKVELSKLLDSLKNNPHERAKEMYMTAKAQFISDIENNEVRALDTVNDAIATFPKSIYPLLAKIDICKKYHNWEELSRTITTIESAFQSDSDIFTKLTFISVKAIVMAREGNIKESYKFISDNSVKHRFLPRAWDKLKEEIDSISG